ncbi:LysR family transcriptional regulator [Mycolicibacterium hodleri]|uniref:LysR family transcriptional regulator n=1 Tax=Mycolicibacterium hodleri TaxID=49897 RepID=A0A502EJJ8_9MYCO|nr:LysR family transcriptional regulator [Mycolicibacterium hodleri]TPG37284.1 LysR family transcriptional regulator [Mycolicibacterium hodleri]
MAIGGFDLNLVPALDALLEERNVTRAAERMSVGQPAMSAALARLRRHFDDPLLVRDGRTYLLSTFAQSLLEPVREAMSALDTATSTQRGFDPATETRTFTIATSDYAALVFMRPLLARLAHEAPQVRLRLVPIRLGMGDALRRGSLDLVILPMELADDLHGLPRKALFEDRFVLAADRDNPALAGIPGLDDSDRPEARAAITLDLLTRLPFVAITGEMPPLVDIRLREQGIELRVDVTTEAFVIAPMLLRDTPLVSLVQERLARLVAEQAHLRLYPSPIEVGTIIEAMHWSPRSSDDPAHRWLRTRFINHAQHVLNSRRGALAVAAGR